MLIAHLPYLSRLSFHDGPQRSVFNAQVDEFESVLNKQHVVQMDTFIKLRGLPYSITPQEIEQFFEGKLSPAAIVVQLV